MNQLVRHSVKFLHANMRLFHWWFHAYCLVFGEFSLLYVAINCFYLVEILFVFQFVYPFFLSLNLDLLYALCRNYQDPGEICCKGQREKGGLFFSEDQTKESGLPIILVSCLPIILEGQVLMFWVVDGRKLLQLMAWMPKIIVFLNLQISRTVYLIYAKSESAEVRFQMNYLESITLREMMSVLNNIQVLLCWVIYFVLSFWSCAQYF